jgi:FixJ family two-component response regulator
MNTNPVFIVDDDTDDHDFIRESWKELGYQNSLMFFSSAEDVLKELKVNSTSPFLILCDVNVRPMSGFDLRTKLLENDSLTHKSVPFIFWSTYASNEQIKRAYTLSAHGFFIKGNTMGELKESLSEMMKYWQKSKQPEII